jgi:3-dehydroquinate synthetase
MALKHTIKLKTVRRCPIIVGEGILNRVEEYFDFSGYSSIVLITDNNVKRLYGKEVMKALGATGKRVLMFTLPVGERAKSLRIVERGYRFLLENNIDRKGLICALGGGVVGDAGGYIAATYLRGIDYIQLPTTLLAQVDSSIGGKVGVNFSGKKNIVGSFYQPRAVVCDVALLKRPG